MLISDKTSWFGFIESGHLLFIGRALGAVLINGQCFFLNQISDFAASRFVSFLVLLVFTGLFFQRLSRKHHLGFFWSGIISFGILLLPSNQVSILWAGNFVPGSLNLLYSFASYLLLERVQRGTLPSVIALSGSLLLFIASLFIYPPTAMFVYVFTFSSILFSPFSQWRHTRLIVGRDLLFFGAGMGIYWIMNRFLIYPLVAGSGHFLPPRQIAYQMAISVNVFSKMGLLIDTALSSASGTWHLYYGESGALITLFLMGFCLFPVAYLKEGTYGGYKDLSSLAQRVFAGAALFFLSNLPSFLAKGNFTLLGYHVLLPGSAMILLLQFWLMRECDRLLQGGHRASCMKAVAIALILAYGLLTSWNVRDTVTNYARELNFIRTKVASADYAKTVGFIIKTVPRGETLIQRRLPFEFSCMITHTQHVEFILREGLRKLGLGMIPIRFLLVDSNVVLDPRLSERGICIIDLNEIRYRT